MAGPQQAVQLNTASSCSLAIGGFPRFSYDASGGGGSGLLLPLDSQGRRPLQFPAGGLRIPPLNGRTGRFLGLPLPPGLQIQIVPQRLEGWLDPASGAVQLHFRPVSCFVPAACTRRRRFGWTPCSPVHRRPFRCRTVRHSNTVLDGRLYSVPASVDARRSETARPQSARVR